MNHISLIGRLTADPTLTTPKDTPICRIRLAVDRSDGGTDFVTVVSFGAKAANDSRWLAKGRQVAITGRLRHNRWTDENGRNWERYDVVASRVIYLDRPRPQVDTPAAA